MRLTIYLQQNHAHIYYLNNSVELRQNSKIPIKIKSSKSYGNVSK